MDDCTDEVHRDLGDLSDTKAKQICSCALKKIEKKYPDMEDAREAMEEVEELKQKTLKECGYKEDDEYGGNDDDYVNDDDNERGSGWTNAQRELYVDQCATVAKQNISASLARSYCDCMQNKIEKKYKMSFTEANKITAEDLSTPEMKEDIQECLGN